MLKRVNARRILLSLITLSVPFILSCVQGGGDATTSKITNTNTGEYAFLQVSPDGKEMRVGGYKKRPNGVSTSWGGFVQKYGENFVSVSSGGTGKVGFIFYSITFVNYREEYVLQIEDKKFRLGYCQTRGIGINTPPPCSSYTWTSWYPLCKGHSVVRVPGTDGLSVEVDSGKLRLVYSDFLGHYAAGNWISVHCVSCPSGYTYNPSRNICEAEPIYRCPYSGRECINEGGGYYCSPYDCVDVATTSTVVDDTPEGINDVQNDGQITDQGCLGTVYIFNGHDYRCRPPGIQTGFSDCCKKQHTWFGLGMCSERERYLSQLRSWGELDGRCHYVGEYCAEKWLGVCVQRKKTFCCYSSPLARIVIEAAHVQLGIPWGDPKHPNCRGLTPEEFQKLDFSKIDFSEWIEYEIQANIIPTVNTSLQNAISNLQTTVQTSVP